jgi:hypothetical protein
MEDTPITRQATKVRIGPWYVLQTRNPSAPGMRFSTLLALVRKGHVTHRSIVRGPTTHQLWRFAARVRGLSREFGVCYGCGERIETTANLCGHCRRSQEPPANPDVLLEVRGQTEGQMPVHQQVVGDSQSPPRTRQKPSGEILSARELAAAFKLDVPSELELPGEAQEARGSHRVLKAILIVLLFSGVVIGAAMLVHTGFHKWVDDSARGVWQSLRGKA